MGDIVNGEATKNNTAINDFNPNAVGVANGNYFALPYSIEESDVVLLPVPWDVTTSYCDGTSNGPEAILDASLQVDLFDENIPNVWENKIATLELDEELKSENGRVRKIAEQVIETLACGERAELKDVDVVNNASMELNYYVYKRAKSYLEQEKLVGVIGGEHSVPLGLIKALGEQYSNFGILHVDAHADLREAYEGFTYSHASIMYNVLNEVEEVSALTQVAVRDFCSDEYELMTNDKRVNSFTDFSLSKEKFNGVTWDAQCNKIISTLPDNVYISFDIDGLLPELCPTTGTPVPGGLSFREADYLLLKLVESGKKIIGFDLCEVAPSAEGEWDANVGARILLKLCLYANACSSK